MSIVRGWKKTLKHLIAFWRFLGNIGIFFKKSVSAKKWSPYIALTLYQKSEKSLELVLIKKIQRHHLAPYWIPFWPKKGGNRLFFNNDFPSLFYTNGRCMQKIRNNPLTLCYKLTYACTDGDKCIAPIPFGVQKRTDGFRTDKCPFIGPTLRGSKNGLVNDL